MKQILVGLVGLVLAGQAQSGQVMSSEFVRDCVADELALRDRDAQLVNEVAQLKAGVADMESQRRRLGQLEADMLSKRDWYQGCMARHGQCDMPRFDAHQAAARYQRAARELETSETAVQRALEQNQQRFRQRQRDEDRLTSRCLRGNLRVTRGDLQHHCEADRSAMETQFCRRFY